MQHQLTYFFTKTEGSSKAHFVTPANPLSEEDWPNPEDPDLLGELANDTSLSREDYNNVLRILGHIEGQLESVKT